MRPLKSTAKVLMFAALCCATAACNKSDDFDALAQFNKETAAIDQYMEENFLPAVKDPRGISMVITRMGTGLPAQTISTLDVDFVGKLFSDGSIFDQGNIKLGLTSFIAGWQIAFTQLPAGTEATLYIPSYYAYKNSARTGIPANSTLVFDVTLNEISYPSSYYTRLGSDTVAIDNYLSGKGLLDDVTKDDSGIRYIITSQGSGNTPGWFQKLKLKYTFKLLSNDATAVVPTIESEPSEEFYSRPVDFVQGMLVGLQKMQVGSKATIYIPSGLAFGPDGAGSNGVLVIPANANLIVEIELIEIK